MYKNNQLWNRYFPRSQRISYRYRETPWCPSIYFIDLNKFLLLFLLTITKQKYFSSSPKLFFFLITLSLNLPRSLWFDLDTPRIILLRSPALGSEQARTCPFPLESYVRGNETGNFQFHVLQRVFPTMWNDNEVPWMHHFYIHKYFFFHQFLQKGLPPSIHHLHFVYRIRLPGLGICKGGSFLAKIFNCWTTFVWGEFHSGGSFFRC